MGVWWFGWCAPRRPGHTPLCCRSSGLRLLAPLSLCERGDCSWADRFLVVWLVNLRRKLALDDDEAVSRWYLEVNLSFYASIILTMIFFSNWFYMVWDIGDASDWSKTRHFI